MDTVTPAGIPQFAQLDPMALSEVLHDVELLTADE
jgi:hypothetical protein